MNQREEELLSLVVPLQEEVLSGHFI